MKAARKNSITADRLCTEWHKRGQYYGNYEKHTQAGPMNFHKSKKAISGDHEIRAVSIAMA